MNKTAQDKTVSTKKTPHPRISRYFSEAFKRKKVEEKENNLTTIAEVSSTYQVSRTSVHRWLNQYSKLRPKGLRQVVEPQSDTRKLKLLQEQIRMFEGVVGQRQLQIDFLDKMIQLAEEEHKLDIKKKLLPYPGMVLGASKRAK